MMKQTEYMVTESNKSKNMPEKSEMLKRHLDKIIKAKLKEYKSKNSI